MMGGSLAKAIRDKKLSKKIYAYDIDQKCLRFAKKNKIIDGYDNVKYNYLADADLIIICSPVSTYKEIFKIIKLHKKSDSIITDIGSTKTNVINDYKKIFNNKSNLFIGSHPLTGKEKSSIKNSDSNIFKNTITLLTPIDNKQKLLIALISKFWKKLNTKIFVMSPDKHDLVLSETSHLPHLVSFALVSIILNTKSIKKIEDYTGGGFRDFARLAHSDPIMWKDICLSNEKNITKSINSLIKELNTIKTLITNKNNTLAKYLKNIKIKLEKNDK